MLDGEIALVTGGGQGIGFAIARRLGQEGARVVVADVNGEGAEGAAGRLGQERIDAAGVAGDVRDPGDVERMVAESSERFGPISILVNNAGITRDATMRKMSLDEWQAVIDVHLRGSWLCTKAGAEVMREAQRGSIVNVSSTSGKVGMVGQTNYSSAKAGIIGLTKAAAKELARHGIRVNALQPGLIRTPLTERMPAEIWDQKQAEVPLGRAGEPEEVAAAALFLASDLSSYITGAVIEVSGGRFM
jgi:3-oxoacyl-[acyl-carrier protein] reductase